MLTALYPCFVLTETSCTVSVVEVLSTGVPPIRVVEVVVNVPDKVFRIVCRTVQDMAAVSPLSLVATKYSF